MNDLDNLRILLEGLAHQVADIHATSWDDESYKGVYEAVIDAYRRLLDEYAQDKGVERMLFAYKRAKLVEKLGL